MTTLTEPTTQHTPGPWHVETEDGVSYVTAAPNNVAVCSHSDGSSEANARLIAAAPDLLAALENAAKLIPAARVHFPKSVRNSEKFQLELLCAETTKTIAKAKGGAL